MCAYHSHEQRKLNFFENKRGLCIVTGASRGFGRACVEVLAEAMHHAAPGSGMLLISRNEDALAESRKLAMNEHAGLNVVTCPLDLVTSDNNALKSYVGDVLIEKFPHMSLFEVVLIVHNAGSLGDISKRAVEQTDYDHVDKQMKLNVTSPIVLTAMFNHLIFDQMKDNSLKYIVNVSSLAAIKAFECWSLYCTNKAARDMFFKCLALESPNVRVLNYAPGPLDTDMQEEIRIRCGDERIRSMFIQLMDENKLIRPIDSAKKMIEIIFDKSWSSGDHIDYFDYRNNS